MLIRPAPRPRIGDTGEEGGAGVLAQWALARAVDRAGNGDLRCGLAGLIPDIRLRVIGHSGFQQRRR